MVGMLVVVVSHISELTVRKSERRMSSVTHRVEGMFLPG